MTGTALRGAIVGYGNVAENGHMPFWRDSADAAIVAAVDADPARRALFAADGGRAYASLSELLAAEQLDFVDICTSPSSHAGAVEQALAAGLHVLCEKPLTIAVADTLRIAAQARAAVRVVHTVHNWLAAPVCRKVSQLVAGGAIGRVTAVDWATLRTAPAVAVAADGTANWRLDPRIAGGGILIDHGWHALYCVSAWAGAAPVSVAAQLESRRFLDLGVEDTATLAIAYEAGVRGSVHLSWAADERANTIGVQGSEGRIDVRGATVTLTNAQGDRRWDCPPALEAGSHHPDWFAGVGNDFTAAMKGIAVANIDQAVRCSQLIDAAQRSSAEDGGSVAL